MSVFDATHKAPFIGVFGFFLGDDFFTSFPSKLKASNVARIGFAVLVFGWKAVAMVIADAYALRRSGSGCGWGGGGISIVLDSVICFL